jgi:hypothetical protein
VKKSIHSKKCFQRNKTCSKGLSQHEKAKPMCEPNKDSKMKESLQKACELGLGINVFL